MKQFRIQESGVRKQGERGALAPWWKRIGNQSANAKLPNAHRPGVTLTEVLMSMMIMSIGLISLASLFPISVLRTIQATQLTQATNLRYNAEAMIGLYPQLTNDPDNDGILEEHNGSNFIVDPLGWALINNDTFRNTFGNDGNGAVATGVVARFHGGFFNSSNNSDDNKFDYTGYRIGQSVVNSGDPNDASSADSVARLPDSWVTVADLIPEPPETDYTTFATPLPPNYHNHVHMPTDFNLQSIKDIVDSGQPLRAILFHPNNKGSQIRTLESLNFNVTDRKIAAVATPANGGWATSNPLPTEYTSVPRVLIETNERRYSWLLTVRKSGSVIGTTGAAPSAVDVVIFFKRAFSTDDEKVYSATFNSRRPAEVIVTAAVAKLVKKGGFIFDPVNALWYRVQLIEEEIGRLTLERNARRPISSIMIMRGVVDVFPIGSID